MSMRMTMGGLGAALMLAAAAPAQTPAGVVIGTVYDGATGEIVRGVRIEIVDADVSTVTDLDGGFRVAVPVGTYEIRAAADGYLPNRYTGLDVSSDTDAHVDIVLASQAAGAIEGTEITVVAETVQASTRQAMILERRSAATVSDRISSQEISANGDSNAASAVSRTVGVSVMDDKYVYVRGLGERFSTTQLNGSLLPSTEADRKVVPLDLFPANLVDNISLEKTFTPDQPGEFSGGLVNIETVEFPTSGTLSVSMSQGFNTRTTFGEYFGYPGGSHDWLGFGDSRRHLPAGFPDERIVRRGRFSTTGFTPEEIESFGESFENVWAPRTHPSARPNQSYSLLAGNTFGNLGVVYAISYSNALHNDGIAQNYYKVGAGDSVERQHSYRMNLTTNSVRLGNTLNFAYKLDNNHKILFKNFFSKDVSDEARQVGGYNADFQTDIRNQRLRFVEEAMYAHQVSGEHFLGGLNGMVEWRLAYNRGDRDEPDLREVLYTLNAASGQYRLREQTQSGFRQFIGSSDVVWEPGVDLTKFFVSGSVTGSIQGGVSWTVRDRAFQARRFRFTHRRTTGHDLTLPVESLFTPERIGTTFELREDTRPTDSYIGDQDIQAGYGMVDVNLGSGWRVIGGLRIERSLQTLDTVDVFAIDSRTIQTRLDDTDLLPSINVVYSVTPRMNIRGAYSQTLSRPNFRELAPFEFTDVTGGNPVVGNPNLQRTRISNVDARWEWFTGPTELLSASFFYKDFDNPIEQIYEPTAQLRIRFDNVARARNWGFETEFRQGLARLAPALGNFSWSANYTWVDSGVEIGDLLLSVVTSTRRPLAAQSRHVFNSTFEYADAGRGHTSRLLYNMVGRRIHNVGALGLPDIYEEAQHVLDFVMQQRIGGEDSPLEIKFSADNLLDDRKELTQGGEPYRTFRNGRGFSVGFSYDFY